jgi:hypothetical protein
LLLPLIRKLVSFIRSELATCQLTICRPLQFQGGPAWICARAIQNGISAPISTLTLPHIISFMLVSYPFPSPYPYLSSSAQSSFFIPLFYTARSASPHHVTHMPLFPLQTQTPSRDFCIITFPIFLCIQFREHSITMSNGISTQSLHADDALNIVTDVAPPMHLATTFRYPRDPAALVPAADVSVCFLF